MKDGMGGAYAAKGADTGAPASQAAAVPIKANVTTGKH